VENQGGEGAGKMPGRMVSYRKRSPKESPIGREKAQSATNSKGGKKNKREDKRALPLSPLDTTNEGLGGRRYFASNTSKRKTSDGETNAILRGEKGKCRLGPEN